MSDHAAKLRHAVKQAAKIASEGSESFVVSSERFGVFVCALTGLSQRQIRALVQLANASDGHTTDTHSQNLDNLSGARAE